MRRTGTAMAITAIAALAACDQSQAPTAAKGNSRNSALQQNGLANSAAQSAVGQGAPPYAVPGAKVRPNTIGDRPLVTVKSFKGRMDAVVAVVAHPGGSNPSGTFTISGIPAGATIRGAWFVTTSFSSLGTESATVDFAGTPLGTKTNRDDLGDAGGGLFCRGYSFNVLSLVTGNGSYSYSVTGTGNIYGDALVVVYEHSSLPVRRVVINFGSESLNGSSSATSFAGFTGGAGRLIVFTQADNFGGTDTIDLNGSTVAGPGDLFNQNQGSFASLVETPVTVIGGSNTMRITTSGDWFGLHLGILIAP